jgi:FtsZ-binding cell division protein ZapB
MDSSTTKFADQDDHEVRELRWRVKQLSQQCGRQGETIHLLRCELAEAREITGKVARGEVRNLERQVENLHRENLRRAELIAELREKLRVSVTFAEPATRAGS